ncbi:hypothetical protein K466DRAFT_665180 [Polyporus arcularius HHB13444]|uniref:BTB domain-containing protein n=1 Tax=Polyporus arcularius HHB13444 TaxID=1314778 RepID=A0A5C3P758_9APHY|nr:hypothetical protein K466DRAFT_665180 [Polyporus arcularius HHB13444]
MRDSESVLSPDSAASAERMVTDDGPPVAPVAHCRFSSPQHHPTYYFFDGNIVILLSASNMLYRLHRSYLVLDSGCFDTMLSVRPEDLQEGLSDSHPVVIPDITCEEFDWFLDFQIRHILPTDEVALTALLRLGHFFQYEAAQRAAQEALDRLPTFSAVSKYVLGVRHGIQIWAHDGFKALVASTAVCLPTLEEVERMQLPLYHTLVDTRFRIDAHRRSIAYTIPPVQHASTCPDRLDCELGWKREWRYKVASHLMHPEDALPGHEVLALLGRVEINDVHPACKERMIQRIRQAGIMTHEDVIVEKALHALVG